MVPKPAPHTEAAQLWADVLDVLREQVTRPSFDTWLQDTEGIALNNVEGLTVSAPDTFRADMLRKRLGRHIEDAVADVRPGDAVAVHPRRWESPGRQCQARPGPVLGSRPLPLPRTRPPQTLRPAGGRVDG